MAKRRQSPAVFDKAQFLKPRMEATGEGFFVRELGGKSLLAFKELVEEMQKQAGKDAELSPSQGIDLMARFVMFAACDENGHPVFDEGDLDLLAEKSSLIDIANQAMPMSGINPSALNEVAVDLKNELPASSITD